MNPRHRLAALAGGLVLAVFPGGAAHAQDPYAAPRQQMLADIVQITRDTRFETGRAQLSQRVTAAMAKVPRHRFVPPELERHAYANRPLPIGMGQTISQPFIVALMTDLLEIKPGDRVLEVGTGSGYQAAVLAELAAAVYTIEIVEPLARQATERLKVLGYRNVVTRTGDGYAGWPDQAPFDGIMVTAGAREVPPALLQQLKPGGKLVIPVGPMGAQVLMVYDKGTDGRATRREVLPVRFVPLTGGPR